MADEITEAVQIIRVAYDGIEIAMKIGSDGLSAVKKVFGVLKGMLDYEKNLGRTSMRKLLMRGGDLQVLQFDNSEIGKVKRLAKKYGILYSMMPNINKNQTEIIFHSEAVPRINVMLQKMKSGQISTFDDYVKKSDADGKNKLLDFFQKQKEGNEKFQSEESEKAGEIMQGLIEKVGIYAVENKSVSVDSIKNESIMEMMMQRRLSENLSQSVQLKNQKQRISMRQLWTGIPLQKELKATEVLQREFRQFQCQRTGISRILQYQRH